MSPPRELKVTWLKRREVKTKMGNKSISIERSCNKSLTPSLHHIYMQICEIQTPCGVSESPGCVFPPSTCSRLRAECKSVLLSSDALQGNPVSRVTISTAVIYSNSRACDSQVCVTFTRLWLYFWMREKYRVGVCRRRRRGAPVRFFFLCVCACVPQLGCELR